MSLWKNKKNIFFTPLVLNFFFSVITFNLLKEFKVRMKKILHHTKQLINVTPIKTYTLHNNHKINKSYIIKHKTKSNHITKHKIESHTYNET